MEGMIFFYLILCIALAVYCGKRAEEKGYKKNYGQLLALLLGIIGWVIVEFLLEDKNNPEQTKKIGAADELLKYKQLLDAGAITQTEYEQKKRELLS